MLTSQNARFSGNNFNVLDQEEPPGRWVAEVFRQRLSSSGWTVTESERRGAGWSIMCTRWDANLDVMVEMCGNPTEWDLMVAPARTGGWLAFFTGTSITATSSDVYALATDVSRNLLADERFANMRWCWDGEPGFDGSSPEPTPP